MQHTEEVIRLYAPVQITVGAFLRSLAAGCFLSAENFQRKPDAEPKPSLPASLLKYTLAMSIAERTD